MLIVVGIIGFLIAMIVNVFINASGGAKVKATKALIGKIGIALARYEGELRSLPPDTGYDMPFGTKDMRNADGEREILYDTCALWRYLGCKLEVRRQDGSVAKVVGPFTSFSEAELRPYEDVKYSERSYYVCDAWGNPISYIGSRKRVIHARGSFDIFSAGPDGKTATNDGLDNGIAQKSNDAFDGKDSDGDGEIDNASELGEAQMNGNLTARKREKVGDEILDDINNWDGN
jgi:type II secretory pathway pseudopilin PulG